MADLFVKYPRLLVLSIALILTAGIVAFVLLPRMEDPRLTPRVAALTTILPGADAMRVESLVTEKIETELKEIEEIKEITSTSSTGVSLIVIELNDNVSEVESTAVWSRVRDSAEDARVLMPAETGLTEFKRIDITSNGLIVGLRWDRSDPPNYAILGRLLKNLKDDIDAIAGTEKSELFGEPNEEILVTLDPDAMASLQLTPTDIAAAISRSDSKVSAGQLRTEENNILLEVAGELDTLSRVGQVPIKVGRDSSFVTLSDLAKIEKTIESPQNAKVLLADRAAIVLAVQVRASTRLDNWTRQVEPVLEAFEAELPPGVALTRVFEQNPYVQRRMKKLLGSLFFGGIAVTLIIFLMMGWRSAMILGGALPLISLMVLGLMYALEIPIHQMSITGLIIALGLMIDNAIVVVDEISQRLRAGQSASEAVKKSTKFLLMPLVGSTVTTTLSFTPIILMEGPAGEFVGSIAVVAVLAVISSLLLALTIIASVSAVVLKSNSSRNWFVNGFSSNILTGMYHRVLVMLLHFPFVGILLGTTFPILGFIVAMSLSEQFFPPADRNQFQIELELPATASIDETERTAIRVRDELLSDKRLTEVAWFLGESAPSFYYNLLPTRKNQSYYAQAIVDCQEDLDIFQLMNEKQRELDAMFPQTRVIVRQLEQGPFFAAPLEVRLFGPDPTVLRRLGEELRLLLTQTKYVTHTRAGFSEALPKVTFTVDEQKARLTGFNHLDIASKLNTSLEGAIGGSILESSEELPVRVRLSNDRRADLNQIASMDLVATTAGSNRLRFSGVPLGAISTMSLDPELVSITRSNGVRVNEVQAFIDAGVLPADVLLEFQSRMAASEFSLPAGYRMKLAGAHAEREDAVGTLIANGFIIGVLMVTTLVIATGSFRQAGLLFLVAGLSVGLGLGSVWLVGYPWGFMSIVGIMGMIGIAVNDSIVVLATIGELPPEQRSNPEAIARSVVSSTRHVLATTLTTIVGFVPLIQSGGDFWGPVAVSITGGVGGASLIALIMVPCAYRLVYGRARSFT